MWCECPNCGIDIEIEFYNMDIKCPECGWEFTTRKEKTKYKDKL